MPSPPSSPLFPTRRSSDLGLPGAAAAPAARDPDPQPAPRGVAAGGRGAGAGRGADRPLDLGGQPLRIAPGRLEARPHPRRAAPRSEEHTSELQSLTNLVCRRHRVLHSFLHDALPISACRELLPRRPREIQIHSLRLEESRQAAEELAPDAGPTVLSTSAGNLFGLLQGGSKRDLIRAELRRDRKSTRLNSSH